MKQSNELQEALEGVGLMLYHLEMQCQHLIDTYTAGEAKSDEQRMLDGKARRYVQDFSVLVDIIHPSKA